MPQENVETAQRVSNAYTERGVDGWSSSTPRTASLRISPKCPTVLRSTKVGKDFVNEREPPSIHGLPVVSISVIAAAAMIGCAFIQGDVEGDLSMESVMLDTVADAVAAIGVAISGAIILATNGTYWLDSLVALLIAMVVAYHALRVMRRAQIDLRDNRIPPSQTARKPG